MTIRITEYLVNNEGKQGIYFYGSKIYSFDVPDKVASYEFNLFLKDDEDNIEPIKFIDTLNLKDLPTKELKLRRFLDTDNPIKTIVDWDTFVQQTQPELYKYHKSRLLRKQSKISPSPNMVSNEVEFLEFTVETADWWGGPYKLESKKGCYGYIQELKEFNKPKLPFNIKPIETAWSYYDLPYSYSPKEQYYNIPNKAEVFQSFPIDIQLRLAKKYVGSLSNIEEFLPYSVYLYGNDDCSYTKYFCTLEEAQQELVYLRMMQPLDFKLDILDREYLFTN